SKYQRGPSRAMKPICTSVIAIAFVVLAGCGRPAAPAPPSIRAASTRGPGEEAISLVEARKGFKTQANASKDPKEPVPPAPANLFRTVLYDSPAGKLAAYVTPDPKDGKKHPAIIWIHGGDSNSIDEGCWEDGPPENDQSGGAFRKAGIVSMFPSL